jgi:predicted transporter
MPDWLGRLREVRIGIVLALLVSVFGFGLGGAFGGWEDQLKGHLDAEGRSVLATTYGGDEKALKAVTDKSWTYFQRAHLHANGLSTASLAMILLLAGLPVDRRLKAVVAGALGVGALGYGMYWLFAGLLAPALGSTRAAKESLQWLAVPTAGLCILGLLSVLVLAVRCLFSRSRAGH